MIDQLALHPLGGLLGVPVRDTLKQTNAASAVLKTVDRENIWHALTPQMFRFEKLCRAMQQAIASKKSITDEASAIELMGETPVIIEGQRDNIKITYPDDLKLAEKILLEA